MKAKRPFVIKNRQAHNYNYVGNYTAGMSLRGHEVRAIKNGQVNLTGSHVRLLKDEAWLVNAYFGQGAIKHKDAAMSQNPRKLLLTKRELLAVKKMVSQKYHIVPRRIIVNHGYLKLVVGIGLFNKKHDKRELIRSREALRQTKSTPSTGL